MRISIVRDTQITLAFAGVAIGVVLFVIWANFLITAWSNAVNLTDGLDGLAAGATSIAFGAYRADNLAVLPIVPIRSKSCGWVL